MISRRPLEVKSLALRWLLDHTVMLWESFLFGCSVVVLFFFWGLLVIIAGGDRALNLIFGDCYEDDA